MQSSDTAYGCTRFEMIRIESFNKNMLRHGGKVVREHKRDDSTIVRGLQNYHNFIRLYPA